MSEPGTQVFLISGFLGSGKTSFLNHMLKDTPPDLKLLVLMNEFGEESIDGALVEDPELEMLEISKGSIFCACVKGDFIKALYQIAFVIKPEVLVIEASGVANPTDIGRDLFNPIYKGVYKTLEKVCVIDAANFLEQYEVFTALEKQVEAADNFIVNKTDLVDVPTIDSVKEVVLRHNPKAKFVETTYGRVSVADLISLPASSSSRLAKPADKSELLSDTALEEAVDRILEDEAAQVTPPDRLISITCRWHSGSVEDFRPIADKLPADVVRAKGFIIQDGRPYLYSHVGHSYDIEPFDGSRLLDRSVNRVVFIRREFQEDDIRSLFAEQGLNLV
ncbi:CobW family GTP-binding protein [Desulfomonile tiedjei]|uniref:Putative GTPase, G3E family n=1 Tax=Desulfomonile tiedjei (strain ATCC 49306 / DSM 6799 / DCB-1) TaxID=706587 RepID=I4C200_DESTA|nr:GTP-binding protein [Desulfomonile tiedjei]AFM23591.1 putative GTPase, G3E family [Desulfomonile tiedjei DSM 6799]